MFVISRYVRIHFGCITFGTDGKKGNQGAKNVVDLMQDLLNPEMNVYIIINEREKINLVKTGEGRYTYMTDAELRAWKEVWAREEKKFEEQLKFKL